MSTDAPGVGAVYESPDGYAIRPPAGWVLYPTDGRSGVSVVFAAPAANEATAPFVDNLNVVITPDERPLDSVVAETKAESPDLLANYCVVSDQRGVVHGTPAHVLGSTYDDPRCGPLESVQLILVRTGTMYTATFTAPAVTFGGLREVMRDCLATFRLS